MSYAFPVFMGKGRITNYLVINTIQHKENYILSARHLIIFQIQTRLKGMLAGALITFI